MTYKRMLTFAGVLLVFSSVPIASNLQGYLLKYASKNDASDYCVVLFFMLIYIGFRLIVTNSITLQREHPEFGNLHIFPSLAEFDTLRTIKKYKTTAKQLVTEQRIQVFTSYMLVVIASKTMLAVKFSNTMMATIVGAIMMIALILTRVYIFYAAIWLTLHSKGEDEKSKD